MAERLDIVVFGATGYTGKYAVKNVHLMAKKSEKPLTWGIAGRNEEKLKDVLDYVKEKTGDDVSSIKIIIADINDEESLKKMTEQARCIVNCCGPYRLYGEQVIKACVETGTHHVDVSGEPQFIEKTQLDYHKVAKERGIYIVSACGFDSIPADLGVIFMQNKFEGTVNSVETYLETHPRVKDNRASAHYGTYESLVHGIAHWNELAPLRRKLYPERLPTFAPKLKSRGAIHKSEFMNNKWTIPFLGSDKSVIYRSQRYLFENDKKRPAQVATYYVAPNFVFIIGGFLFAMVMGLLTRFQFGIDLLLKHPKFFTGGFFSHEGPSEKFNENLDFAITFVGKGWSEGEGLAEPTDQYTSPPKKTMITKVSGTDPGYDTTSKMLLWAGRTLINETDKLPEKGGVYAPGAAFAKTNLIKNLMDNEVLKFEVISTSEE